MSVDALVPAMGFWTSLLVAVGIAITASPWYALIPAALAAVCLRPTLKLLVLPPASAAFRVTPDAVVLDDLEIPWTAVAGVHMTWMLGPATRSGSTPAHRNDGPPGKAWSLITLEITDFTSLRHVTAPVAGLANLSRRREVILAAAADLREPEQVLEALRFFAAHPERRSELGTPEGARRFTAAGRRPD